MRWAAIPFAVALSALVLGGCGVQITTGQSAEETSIANEERARAYKAQFAEQFMALGPADQADMLIGYFEQVGGGLLQFGRDISNQWRQGERGRAEAIEASEMREQIGRWTASERPILLAWEENLEFGLRMLREQHYFGNDAMATLQSMVDYFYKAYSLVIFPSGPREDYEASLYNIEHQIDALAEDARWAIQRDS